MKICMSLKCSLTLLRGLNRGIVSLMPRITIVKVRYDECQNGMQDGFYLTGDVTGLTHAS